MPFKSLTNSLTFTDGDLAVLRALSLKGYRFLSIMHITMLYGRTESDCHQRIEELCGAGLVKKIFIPKIDHKKPEEIYTLTPFGASELARLNGTSFKGLATARKPSYLFDKAGHSQAFYFLQKQQTSYPDQPRERSVALYPL